MLENGTIIMVDNYLQNGSLTFTYNLDDCPTLPGLFDLFLFHQIRPNTDGKGYYHDLEKVKYRALAFKWTRPRIKGFFIYDSFNTHFMSFACRRWNWLKGCWRNGPALPIFSINESVGNWLLDHSWNTTISGYLDQEFKRQTKDKPGVVSHNVVGYRNISKSLNDSIIVISNRYDGGFWGEAAGDCALGAGVVLAIAKYFNDSDIKPKYNLTFLMTTGEEYGMRGAHHYVHSQPDNKNFKMWIGADQLGFNQNGTNLSLVWKNEATRDIVCTIANTTDYTGKVGNRYGFIPRDRKNEVGSFGVRGTDTQAWINKSEDWICMVKDNTGIWNMYQRSGMDYTEGDVLKNIDREDANATLELFWNITKYFCVNPDCWFDNTNISVVDSDDGDDLVDTISFSFDVTSTLPHDLAMVNYSLTKAISNDVVAFENINFTVNRSAKSKTVNITLPSGESPGFHVFRNDLYNSTGRINEIINSTIDNTNQTESFGIYFLYPYGYCLIPPNITNVSATPNTVGYGYNVTISADVTSNVSSIDKVTVNITYPDETINSYNMSNTAGDTYQYIFNDTWQHRQYDYVIWAKDVNGNESGSSQYSFNVTINATISVCTIKDSYGNNEIVNVTDPPCNQPLIGYELLNDGKVLRIWNKFDSYYFDTDNGVQFTNHYDEYWSHNVLMLGYYNNDEWNLIYRTDNLSGFNQDIETDDTSFVNATLWKNLNYKGYDFRLAIRYHLGVDDNELTIIPYIKNIDDGDIPYVLGFAWEIKDIQIDMTSSGDYIEINGTTYFLNGDLDETYKNMDDPCYYIREDLGGDKSKSLYLRWDENLNDIVQVKSRDGRYNAPITLGIKIGPLNIGQEKQTKMFWHDADEAIYYFNNYDTGESWFTNPSYMVDGNRSNYASTGLDADVELCNSSNCSGSDLGTISKVELRVDGYYSGDPRDIILRPVFNGTTDGGNYHYQPPTIPGIWSPWFDITDDLFAPESWSWTDVQGLDCDVEVGPGMLQFTLYCSKVEIRVTYTPPTYPPEISDPYPPDNSTGISLTPLLNITVVDPNGDSMDISWLSNSSGSWQTFGTNNSVGNGTYHQTMSNASVNGQWWYWNVNVSDGTNYTESSVYRFYTGYESKIVNTGSTHFKGYLLIQVQFYNETSDSWVIADDTINETTPRTILWADPGGTPGQNILALDTIFNGLVNTSNLSGFGNGTYHVYAAFRDPVGTVLVCDDEGLMEDSYEFIITFD